MNKLSKIILALSTTIITTPLTLAAGVVGTGTPISCDEAAFDAALSGGGSVTFDCGAAPHTITLTGVKTISSSTTIDGGSLVTLSGGNSVKLFNVDPGVTFSTSNITLADGFCGIVQNGGAVALYGPATVGNFTNTTFDNNNCLNQGGALYATDALYVIDSSVFTGNQSTIAAGAIHLNAASATIIASTFSNNSAGDNGVIGLVNSSTINIDRSYFNQNSSPGNSVMEVQSGSTGTITLSNFFQNNSGVNLLSNSGSLSISRTSFQSNSSGSILNNTGDLTLTNSTIGNNDVSAGITAVAIGGLSSNNIINSTITENTGGAFSGGVSTFSASASVNFTDTIVSNNSPTNCTGSGLISLGGNIEDINSCNFVDGTDQVNTDPLLTVSALGANQDFPSSSSYYYSLQSGSPAIDNAVGVVGQDQLGRSRPLDGDDNGSLIADSGSIEFVESTPPVISVVTTIPTPSSNTTPSYTFLSSEAGTINYGGACSSPTTTAIAGNNTIILNSLPIGTYSGCTITVTDAFSNVSLPLTINTFEIISVPVINNFGSGGSAEFGKPACSGAECNGVSANGINVAQNQTAAPTEFFTDISSHWAKDYINNLHLKCDVNGFKDAQGNLLHIFKPDQSVTRAELVAMIVQCKKLTATTSLPTFPDAQKHWASSIIALAESLKITSGYPDGSFKPDQNVNRAEALKMIILAWYSAEQIVGQSTICKDIIPASWYAKYFYFALNKNIISGYQGAAGVCGPANNITRAEVAKILSNLITP